MTICTSDYDNILREILLFRNVLGEAMEAATKRIILNPPHQPAENKLQDLEYLRKIVKRNDRALKLHEGLLTQQAKDQWYFRINNRDFREVCDLADYEPTYVLQIYHRNLKKKSSKRLADMMLMLQQYADLKHKLSELIRKQERADAKETLGHE